MSYIYTVFLCTYCKAYTALLSMKLLYTVLSVKYSAYAHYNVAAQIGLNPFTSFPVAHAMVDDMVNQCGLYVICDYVYVPLSPSSPSSSSCSLAPSSYF